MRKSQELTLKQRRFIENYTNPDSPTFGNQSKSGLAAGYTDERLGRKNAHIPKIRKKIEEILEKKGFGTDQILDRIVEVANVKDSAKDRTNVLQACRMLLELQDKFPSKKVENKIESVGNVDAKDVAELKGILEGLKNSSKK